MKQAVIVPLTRNFPVLPEPTLIPVARVVRAEAFYTVAGADKLVEIHTRIELRAPEETVLSSLTLAELEQLLNLEAPANG